VENFQFYLPDIKIKVENKIKNKEASSRARNIYLKKVYLRKIFPHICLHKSVQINKKYNESLYILAFVEYIGICLRS